MFSFVFINGPQWLLGALCLLLLACLLFSEWRSAKNIKHNGRNIRDLRTMVFLFRRGILVDANARALDLLSQNANSTGMTWQDVRNILSRRIAGLPTTLGNTEHSFRHLPFDALEIEVRAVIENWAETTRISVFNWQQEGEGDSVTTIFQSELDTLNKAARLAPLPIWSIDCNNKVRWANDAYLRLFNEKKPCDPVWPETRIKKPDGIGDQNTFRASLKPNGSETLCHYEITVAEHGANTFFFAANADRLTKIEVARRELIQTLTKTFAQLSVGLAVFDKDRQLVLYNPALVDLLELKGPFLSSGPTFSNFFEHLRVRQIIPEPPRGTSWREYIASIEIDVMHDRFKMHWQTAVGLTYRVSGRPLPNGAMGLLFEDISTHLSIERNFRSQIDLRNSIIDDVQHPIAAVSRSGTFVLMNQAFKTFWRVETKPEKDPIQWSDFKEIWQSKSLDFATIEETYHFLQTDRRKPEMKRTIPWLDNQHLELRVDSFSHEIILLSFHIQETKFIKQPGKKYSVA